VLLAAEFLLVAAVAIVLLLDLLTTRPVSLPSAIALTVLAFVAAAWLGAIVVGAWRQQSWIRSAVVVWQVLQFAIGAGAITGAFSNPALGWPLVIVAFVTFVLALASPSTAKPSGPAAS
jgi:hypothetical protein